jgi:hypothetical protein
MLQKLNFKPGFNKMITDSGAESQWVDGDFVRFRYGLPEKIGGWNQLTTSSLTLPGPARAQHSWTSLAGEKYVAIGTSQGLFLYYEERFFDITPLDTAITGADFDATSGSATVTVNKTAHGLLDGRYVTFSSVTVPTGSGYATTDFTENTFEVRNKTANTFEIIMPSNSAGTTSGTGSAQIDPYVIVGPTFQTAGSVHNGKTFTWNAGASGARGIRATVMSGAPTASRLTQVSDRDRHVFHFGTETTIGDPTTQDPMFIRFSNQEDFNTYTPTATNTAGTFRVDKGNKIVGAVSGKDYTLVLTDSSAYVIQFVGPPFTFSVRQVGTNCGLIGQNALSYSNGIVFWMSGEGGFFMYDGTVKSIPCLVEDFVFTTTGDNLGINYNASDIIYAEHNTLYNEINWFYAKNGSDQIDRCATYNY